MDKLLQQSSSLNQIQLSLRSELDKVKADIVKVNYDKLQLSRENKSCHEKIAELNAKIANLVRQLEECRNFAG